MLADSRDAKFSRGVDGAYFGAYPQEPLSSTIPFMIVCFFLDFVTHFWFRFIDFGPCDDAMISVAPITALRFAQARVLGLMRKNCWTLSAEDRRSKQLDQSHFTNSVRRASVSHLCASAFGHLTRSWLPAYFV